MQGAYAPEQLQQYYSDLGSASVWDPNSTQAAAAHYSPEEAIALYNARDPRLALDQEMTANILRAKDYFKTEGSFTPGSSIANAEVLRKALRQWDVDRAPTSFERFANSGGIAKAILAAAAPGMLGAIGQGLGLTTAGQGFSLAGELGVTNPYATQIINQGAIGTLTNGGDPVRGFGGAALGVGTNAAAGTIGSELPDLGKYGNQAVTSGAGALIGAGLTGQDPIKALIGAELGVAVGGVSAQVPGFSSMDPTTQRIVSNAVGGALAGRSPEQITAGALNTALNAGMRAANTGTTQQTDIGYLFGRAGANTSAIGNMLDAADFSALGNPGDTGDPYSTTLPGQETENPEQYYGSSTYNSDSSVGDHNDPYYGTAPLSNVTLDPVTVTATRDDSLDWMGTDGEREAGSTDTTALSPVTVTGPRESETTLDPVTVTGSREPTTTLSPVTVTAAYEPATALDPVTITGSREPIELPPMPVPIVPETPIVTAPTPSPSPSPTPIPSPSPTPSPTPSPKSVTQYLSTLGYVPSKTELADIKTLFNIGGPSIFQVLRAGLSPEQALKYMEYGLTPESIMETLGLPAQAQHVASSEPSDELANYLRS